MSESTPNGHTNGVSSTSSSSSPVVVPLSGLAANSLPLSTLTSAFGPSSLGIIIVKDLPPQFRDLRARLLQYASYLAHLPAEELERVTVPEAKYLTGWSHGKETLKSGKKDEFKGSWYTNCSFYHDRGSAIKHGAMGAGGGIDAVVARLACEEAEREAEEEEEERKRNKAVSHGNSAMGGGEGHEHKSPDYRDYPEYSSPNVWPSEDLLPGFKSTLEEMVCLIIDVAVLVARQCDRFAEETGIEGYQRGYLERVVSTSKTTKARLLHYFPPKKVQGEGAQNGESVQDVDDDDWCTTHKDHGCLTGLTSALFVDESDPAPLLKDPKPNADGSFNLPQLNALKASPDPNAGLYIRSRTGELTKVAIPPDCLAFQTGEALERVTKGKFAAVPHFVRGPQLANVSRAEKVARNTLAVFTQPNLGEHVDDKGTTFAQFAKEIVDKNTVEA